MVIMLNELSDSLILEIDLMNNLMMLCNGATEGAGRRYNREKLKQYDKLQVYK